MVPSPPGLAFGLRFDLRNPGFAGTSMPDRYAAALEMTEWADRLGGTYVSLAEHHGSEDGYVPSPLVLLSAMAARTTSAHLAVAALIAPFYDPLRLAEDMLVLDNLSRGRVSLVIGAGYVPEEFEMYGVPMTERVRRVVEVVETLQGAFSGEPFEYRGRTVHLTPGPHSERFRISLGGSSAGAGRRAARLGLGFVPSSEAAWDAYRAERIERGRRDPGPMVVGPAPQVFLARDPDQGWAEMGPYLLHESNSYGELRERGDVDTPYRTMADLDDLRASGSYLVLRPEEYVARIEADPASFPLLHPLCGGMPVDLAWASLRLFEHEVLPAFA
jgi:alkanesulfonate monooxygenase SsuD/methylene tetrahydromethanopterin reductase-like flavin-dependent oxidoreductase (luciferase family)